MPRQHTDREYEGELSRIREMLLMMGAKVEEMLSQAMKALVERDSDLAERTLAIDRQINRLEMEVDDLCLKVLARRQPVASDLRFVTMALKVVTDLERMGDLGVNICERVLELNEDPSAQQAPSGLQERSPPREPAALQEPSAQQDTPLKPYVEVANMAEAAQEMLREALDAFVAGDAERAQHIVERDSKVDAYYATIFRELLTHMMANPRNIYRATRVQSIAKYIERIADHATNVAEMVVFMVRGKDIRHAGRPKSPSHRPPRPNDSDASVRDVVRTPSKR